MNVTLSIFDLVVIKGRRRYRIERIYFSIQYQSDSAFNYAPGLLEYNLYPSFVLINRRTLYPILLCPGWFTNGYIIRNNHAYCFPLHWTLKFRSVKHSFWTSCYFETLIIKFTHLWSIWTLHETGTFFTFSTNIFLCNRNNFSMQ